MDIGTLIRKIPDYPDPGATYYDLTTLMMDGAGFHALIDEFAARYASRGISKFACMEWRGFVIGAALAYRLGAGFVPLRRFGPLPGGILSGKYGTGPAAVQIEMGANAIAPGEAVVFVDDLLATGALTEAAVRIIAGAGAQLVECCFVQELAALGGRERLEKQGLNVFSFWEH